MDEGENGACDVDLGVDEMSEGELAEYQDYETREYDPGEECEQSEAEPLSKEELGYCFSHEKLEQYIGKHGSPSDGNASALERYENVDIKTRTAKNVTVPYETDTTSIDGREITGSFPKFPSLYSVDMPAEYRFEPVSNQEKYCNEALRADYRAHPEQYEQLSDEQRAQIEGGRKPEGFTWNHNQQLGENCGGRMELVDAKLHDDNRHLGGFALYGGEKR